jgi:hypothetical protein
MFKKFNQKQNKAIKIVVIISIVFTIFILFYFSDTKDGKIYIDDNNTENITTEEDLRKIGEKLDGLDINLDDIINELEL